MKARLLILCLCLFLTLPVFAYNGHYKPGLKAMFHSINGGWLNASRDYTGIHAATKNTVAIETKFIGISAEYGGIGGFQTDAPTDFLHRYGIGLGMPDADFIRLYGKYHIIRDYKDFKAYNLELAKSFSNESFKTQIGVEYSGSDTETLGLAPVLEFFTDEVDTEFIMLDIAPKQELRLNLSMSTVESEYLQAASCKGLCPSSHPILLCRKAGMRLDGVLAFAKAKDESIEQSRTAAYMGLPVSFSRWFGIDLKYLYSNHKVDDNYANYSFQEHRASFGLRPVFLILGPLQLTAIADAQALYSKEIEDDYDNGYREAFLLDLGGIFSINISDRALLYAKYHSMNDWALRDDASDIENIVNTFSFGLNVRF